MLYVGNGRYAMPVGMSSAGYAMQQPATQFSQNFTQQATLLYPYALTSQTTKALANAMYCISLLAACCSTAFLCCFLLWKDSAKH